MPSFSKDWLEVDLKIIELYINKGNARRISDDAFNTEHFTTLRVLSISNVPLRMLSDGAFEGLENLEEIRFDNLRLHGFAVNMLNPTKNLVTFRMKNCGQNTVNVGELFGRVKLPSLKFVHIHNCKLFDTITKDTFLGLINITDLRLVSCAISRIGPKSFDIPLESLNTLYLNDNHLQTLPKNLFMARTKPNLELNLNDNPWHCDCALDDLQKIVYSKSDIIKIDSVVCKTPAEYSNHRLELCPSLCTQKLPSKNDKKIGASSFSRNRKPIRAKTEEQNTINPTKAYFLEKFGLGQEEGYESEDEYEHIKNSQKHEHEIDHEHEFDQEDEIWEGNESDEEIDYENENDQENEINAESEYESEYESDSDSYSDFYSDVDGYYDYYEHEDNLEDKQFISGHRLIVECDEPVLNQANISLTEPTKGLLTIRVENDNLYVTAENLSEGVLLFGFEQQTMPGGSIICLGSFEGGNDHTEIEFQLKPNNIYRFCRIIKNVSIMGFLDCVLYYSKGEPEQLDAWLWTENKPIIISVCVVAAVIIVFMGILFSKVLAVIFPKQIRGLKSKDRIMIIEKTLTPTEEQKAICRLRYG